MKVNFFDQPYMLCVIDIVRSDIKLSRLKVLDSRGIDVICDITVIAVREIVRHHNWFDTYEVKP